MLRFIFPVLLLAGFVFPAKTQPLPVYQKRNLDRSSSGNYSDRYVHSVSFMPDSKTIVYAYADSIEFYDLVKRKVVRKMQVGKHPNRFAKVSAKGRWLVADNDQDSMFIYDLKNKKLHHAFYSGKKECCCGNFNVITITDDEKNLAYTYEEKVMIMNIETKKATGSIPVKDVYSLGFSSNNALLAIASTDSLIVYNVAAQKQESKFKHEADYESVNAAFFTPAVNKLLSMGFQGGDGIKVWDYATGKQEAHMTAGHAGDCNSFAIDPTGTKVAAYTGYYESYYENRETRVEVREYNLKTGEVIQSIFLSEDHEEGLMAELNFVFYSPDGKYLGVSGRSDLLVWKLK